jgi:hypothetical protein
VLLLATAWSLPAVAQEQRCTELGAACECSEPMDTTATSIGDGHNFADSPASSECTQFGNGAFFGTNKSNVTTTSETRMPAGNTVDRVVEIPSAGGSIVWLLGRQKVDSSVKRACVRYYKMVTADYSGVGPNNQNCPSERNKIIQYQFGNTQIQLQERANGSVCTGPGTGNDYAPITITNPAITNYDLSPRVDWGDCNENEGWCRIEMCATGNLSEGTNIGFEAKITTLSDGVEHYAEQSVSWSPGTPMRDWSGGDLYHGQGQGGKGTEWVSHFMQASFTSDSGQWIGAAYEVEGGNGEVVVTEPPPPPPPASLEPPVLLAGAEGGQSSGGTQVLSVSVSGTTASASVSNGIGPYHFLFDCSVDGNWNGVFDTSQPAASYTCPSSTTQIRTQMWDEGTNQVLQEVVVP